MTQSTMPSGDGAKNVSTNPVAFRPEWIRLPKEGKNCPFSGLTRSYLANLIRLRLIPSKSVRQPGTVRGVRLICYEGLMAYIRSSEAGES